MTHDADLDRRIAQLTLEEKVELLTGRTGWMLHGAPAAGLAPVTVSDGPAGVRGTEQTQHDHSASTPSPTAIAATWDDELVERVGRFFAAEARRKDVDVVLAPVVNLQRSPLGGRHFECFSEDPLLTGRIGRAFVAGVQSQGVGACPKHFLGNETETQRTSYLARIDERTLREVYLPPFEDAVIGAGAWMVMSAYNGLDDGAESASATDHHGLQTALLKDELGFDGVVVSDWMAARTTAASANAGLDLVMPGPLGPWREALVEAVRVGEVPEEAVDAKVRRLLRLADRVGRLSGPATAGTGGGYAPAAPLHEPEREDEHALLREVGGRGHVLLRNEDAMLPFRPASVRSVALIGPNAVDAYTQGGGSAHVNAKRLVSPADGLRAALPDDVELVVRRGGDARRRLPPLDSSLLRAFTVQLLDGTGAVVETREATATRLHLGAPDPRLAWARITGTVRLNGPGTHRLGFGVLGRYELSVDGAPAGSGSVPASAADILESRNNNPDGPEVVVEVPAAGRDVAFHLDVEVGDFGDFGRSVITHLRHAAPGPTVEEEIAAAVEAARGADVAVVVVGTNSEVESEGYDRATLDLPGRQDELVRRVAAANPRTAVVVNAGAPVLLPWLDEVPAVLWTWFGGQEYGHALADVLTGAAEPTGRLPWTLPARQADVAVMDTRPVDGVIDYTEGVFVGHRAYDRDGVAPARAFGFGLGYTSWEVIDAQITTPPVLGDGVLTAPVEVRVRVANTGPRAGRHVVQVYLEPQGAPHNGRPLRSLAGFGTVEAAAGAEATVRISVVPRAFAVWDTAEHRWTVPTGDHHLAVGSSSRDLPVRVPLALGHD